MRDDECDIGVGTEPNKAADVLAQVVFAALAVSAGAGGAFMSTSMMLAVAALPTYAPAMALVACDPSRTYIDGSLFKNLKEVRVRIGRGAIVGYTYP